MTTQERIDKGIAWLDEVRPGWEKEINVERLDMSEMNNCILGQLFSNIRMVEFFVGLNDFKFVDIKKHGFDTLSGESYEVLRDGWINVIQNRLN